MVRLDRGGAEFLSSVTRHFESLGLTEVFSPALHPASTGSWHRIGYDKYAELDVMECSLSGTVDASSEARVVSEPDWEEVLAVDRVAFDGFWGMSRVGLEEAHATNKDTVLLTVEEGAALSGYAIVGSQWGVTYLHRIAVHPKRAGTGVGTSLLRTAMGWGYDTGGRIMVLNVRPENHRAKGLYVRIGFAVTGSRLVVLRHQSR